jgi:prepilin-type N-terminal cleavage/methylation domain-containing protein
MPVRHVTGMHAGRSRRPAGMEEGKVDMLPRRRRAPRPRLAFTLVELLIVIGIIAVLIAILLPVIGKVRRKGVVLACPIVYHSIDDNALHVTDPHGGHDLRVTPAYGNFHYRRPGHPMWSPSGQKIGFELSNWPAGPGTEPQYMCVLDPMSGAIKKHLQIAPRPRNYFLGWVDDDHFVEGGDQTYVRDADTGLISQTLTPGSASGIPYGPFYAVGPGLPGRWVTNSSTAGVAFVRSDLTLGRTIWNPPAGEKIRPYGGGDYNVDVDAIGEWVAWTATDGKAQMTGFKSVNDSSWATPSFITVFGRFCLWTDDGNLLLSTGNGMIVVDRNGVTVRSFYVPFTIDGGAVAMRRYWHQ